MKEVCKIEDCSRKVLAIELCYYHYAYTRGTCPVEGCTQPIRSKGLCNTHYDHMRGRYKKMKRFPETFWDKVQKSENADGCWEWIGAKQSDGYGNIRYNGKPCLAHRVSWEIHFVAIPLGKEIKQICQNRICVNPSHLRQTEYVAAIHGTLEQRFWPRVCKTKGCWLWTGSQVKGYGVLRLQGKQKELIGLSYVRAHRFSWELHFGTIFKSISVLHKCDVPSCVNPKHLFLGTQTDNIRDMDAKGRRGVVKGSSHPNSVLTDGQVREMRRLHQEEGFGSSLLGRLFHVSQGTAWKVITPGWAWKDMEYAGQYEGKPRQVGIDLAHISYSDDMAEFMTKIEEQPHGAVTDRL